MATLYTLEIDGEVVGRYERRISMDEAWPCIREFIVRTGRIISDVHLWYGDEFCW